MPEAKFLKELSLTYLSIKNDYKKKSEMFVNFSLMWLQKIV